MATPISVSDLRTHPLTAVANDNWARDGPDTTTATTTKFDDRLVDRVYVDFIHNSEDNLGLSILEMSSYLENYLWKHFHAEMKPTKPFVLSVIALINEKIRLNIPTWGCFESRPGDFKRLLSECFLIHTQSLSPHEQASFILFLITAYQSLENALVRSVALSFASLPLWVRLPGRARAQLFRDHPDLSPIYSRTAPDPSSPAAALFWSLIYQFIHCLDDPDIDPAYASRFVELLTDMVSQLPTRRFIRPVIVASHVIERAHLSDGFRDSRLCRQMLGVLESYMDFPIDDRTGEPLSDTEMEQRHYHRLQILQRIAFKHHQPELLAMALAPIGAVDKPESLTGYLAPLSHEQLVELASRLDLIDPESDLDRALPRPLIEQVFVRVYCRKPSKRQEVSQLPLYPTEAIIFDTNLVPDRQREDLSCLPLPKLNLQFISMHDYLIRNFHLYRLESTYQIRQDICMAVSRMDPRIHPDTGVTIFTGWWRMAAPINVIAITHVGRNKVGEDKPSTVLAEIEVDLRPFRGVARQEWDEIKEHDVLFALEIRATTHSDSVDGDERGAKNEGSRTLHHDIESIAQLSSRVRGCEVVSVKDGSGRLIDFQNPNPIGFMRTFTVAFDSAQYKIDLDASQRSSEISDVTGTSLYNTLNLLVRRRPKENNFKAVLESIRDIMQMDVSVPEWFKEVFLGYGAPDQATYPSLANQLDHVDLHDTCVDDDHLRASFPSYQIELSDEANGPPYRLTFLNAVRSSSTDNADAIEPSPSSQEQLNRLKKKFHIQLAFGQVSQLREMLAEMGQSTAGKKPELVERLLSSSPVDAAPKPFVANVTSYSSSSMSYYASHLRNTIPFTPVQVEAIVSGCQPGLTLVVGPPGTGKTDVAVQTIVNLHHQFPRERILLVTHSNHALNDLFSKLCLKDIDPGLMLRLGQGHKELRRLREAADAGSSGLETDFSSRGRIDFMLGRRLMLLSQVAQLAQSIDREPALPSSSCDAAAIFYKDVLQPKMKEFREADSQPAAFPFAKYFQNTIFPEDKADERSAIADRCFAHLNRMFLQLRECRPFEVLRRGRDRADYLLMKHARIVAMTCTHASLKRHDLIDQGFRFHSMIMEEAGQVLDLETCIPLLTQSPDPEFGWLLKRIVLLGDDRQLPPVIQNQAIQTYAHLDQSLFARLVRIGVPAIQLNSQGRTRPAIASLFSWRYPVLGNMPSVTAGYYLLANAGLRHTHQFVDVGDFEGRGESQPSPYFYQNLGEAEYLVQVYIYLRLVGHPASRISVITTYNGQKQLLRDVFNARCSGPIGHPHKITTVDRFQGQQNDIVLLSLVRTRNVGHIRDVRRLVVALSRARFVFLMSNAESCFANSLNNRCAGLYVFGRADLYQNCFELAPAMRQLLQTPTQLQLVRDERHPTARSVDDGAAVLAVKDVLQMAQIVQEMMGESNPL